MKKKLLSLLVFGFSCLPFFGQIELKDNIFQLNEFNDSLTIHDVIKKYKKGNFNKPFPVETYKYFTGKEANWIVIEVDSLQNDSYFSIENSIFEELDFYILSNDQVTIPENLHKKGDYRFPLWHFKKTNSPFKIFVRTKDKFSYRTEFNMVSFSKTKFIDKVEKDYFLIGAYVLGILLLLVAVTLVFIFKKNYVTLWYTIHLSILIIEYLVSTGVFSQWFMSNSIILRYGIDQMSMILSIFALSEFFRGYYKFNKKTLFFKRTYLGISIVCLLGLIYAIVDIICGNIFNVEIYAQSILTYGSITSLVVHFFLAYHKIIPKYLFISFALPVIGVFANLGNLKSHFTNENVIYFIFNSVYIGIIVGGFIMVLYIIKQSVNGEIKAINLSKENNSLKNSFQESLAEIQEQHQNMLVNDVHDSFGGYLEALKLNLLSKNRDDQQIHKLLEAFRKDYKLLLNSLFIPNISSDNFENAILEYCEKMNALSPTEIKFISDKKRDVQLSQNIAKFIFKATSELTTNAIKYAKSKNIIVNLKTQEDEIIVFVKDDGVGFNINNVSKTALGISGIQQRVDTLNGKFEIISKKNKGTTIKIKIPLSIN